MLRVCSAVNSTIRCFQLYWETARAKERILRANRRLSMTRAATAFAGWAASPWTTFAGSKISIAALATGSLPAGIPVTDYEKQLSTLSPWQWIQERRFTWYIVVRQNDKPWNWWLVFSLRFVVNQYYRYIPLLLLAIAGYLPTKKNLARLVRPKLIPHGCAVTLPRHPMACPRWLDRSFNPAQKDRYGAGAMFTTQFRCGIPNLSYIIPCKHWLSWINWSSRIPNKLKLIHNEWRMRLNHSQISQFRRKWLVLSFHYGCFNVWFWWVACPNATSPDFGTHFGLNQTTSYALTLPSSMSLPTAAFECSEVRNCRVDLPTA